MLFILFFLILFLLVHITMTFVCVWRVCVPPFFVFLFPFLVNDLHFILPWLIHVKNHFSLAIIVYIIIVIITGILFFSTLPVTGGELSNWIRAAWSTPTHWLLWVSRSVFLLVCCLCFVFFFSGYFTEYYVIEAVGFNDLSMILVNLWKT